MNSIKICLHWNTGICSLEANDIILLTSTFKKLFITFMGGGGIIIKIISIEEECKCEENISQRLKE